MSVNAWSDEGLDRDSKGAVWPMLMVAVVVYSVVEAVKRGGLLAGVVIVAWVRW
jgi:hypothetical protein